MKLEILKMIQLWCAKSFVSYDEDVNLNKSTSPPVAFIMFYFTI